MMDAQNGLFSPELLRRAETLRRVYDTIASELPQLADKDAKAYPDAPAIQTLANIRERLSQRRYRVGFLGTSQAGKSTTLNSYIGRTHLLPQGNSMSCTSIRIRFFRSGPDDGYQLRFIYMTRSSYELRRDDIGADLLALYDRREGARLTDDAVLSLLNKQSFADNNDRKVGQLLTRLINAGKQYKDWLGDSRKTEDVGALELKSDTDVSNLLKRAATHDGDGTAKWALLEEIQMGIPELELPSNVELVDLPGLSTTRGADDKYTMRAASELNGAIVVVNVADNVARPETYEIVKKLRHEFEGDSSRVWIIGNKTDGVSVANLTGPAGTNIVDTVSSVLKTHAIDPKHFLFTSNECYLSSLSAADYLRTKGIHRDDSGRPLLSTAFDRHPELKTAFLHFCEDGGIKELKRIINGTIEPAIREGLNRQIDAKIVTLADRLHRSVNGARRAAEAGSGGRAVARKWCGAIEQVIALINHNVSGVTVDPAVAVILAGDPLAKTSRSVRLAMKTQLEESLRFAGSNETGTDLRIRFDDASEAMRAEGQRTFASGGEVQKYFDQVVLALATAGKGHAATVCISDPPEHLREQLAAAFVSPWASRLSQDFDSLADRVLIDDKRGIPVNLSEFKTIMSRKADQVVRQREYRYRNFIVTQLRRMLDELREYTPSEAEVVEVDTSIYDSILEPLNELLRPLVLLPLVGTEDKAVYRNGDNQIPQDSSLTPNFDRSKPNSDAAHAKPTFTPSITSPSSNASSPIRDAVPSQSQTAESVIPTRVTPIVDVDDDDDF